jgi:hypothetical protein
MPKDDALIAELTSPTYAFTSTGKMVVESSLASDISATATHRQRRKKGTSLSPHPQRRRTLRPAPRLHRAMTGRLELAKHELERART